jgi:hypothetical protein
MTDYTTGSALKTCGGFVRTVCVEPHVPSGWRRCCRSSRRTGKWTGADSAWSDNGDILELSLGAQSVLATVTQPLPKRVLHRVRYSASSSCALFWVVMQCVTEFLGHPIGPKFNGRKFHYVLDTVRPGKLNCCSWTLRAGQSGVRMLMERDILKGKTQLASSRMVTASISWRSIGRRVALTTNPPTAPWSS